MKNEKNNLLKLTLLALGIVYGDIGTSPLYALKECFAEHYNIPLTGVNIMGILSLIFWTLIFVVIIKYLFFVLKADNNGEGGGMSLLTLITSKVQDLSKIMPIVAVGLIGTSLLLAEGIITPAISVLGAVEGIEVISPSFSVFVVPISAAVIFFLFTFQKHGTEKIGNIFAPVMLVWFLVIGGLGINAIIRMPKVLAAVNPYYAFNFFVSNGIAGFFILGAVVLVITGSEALYADIGHFGKKPIRIGFLALVFPSLILNYFGQGAAIMTYGEVAAKNPFYFICPENMLYPMIILATLAAIIASQALISGSYSIVQQSMRLGFLPKLKIIHTSEDVRGQIYIPLVNMLLMVACLLLVFGFKSSGALASAYGISVMGTMLCTTILYYKVTRKIWKWNKPKSLGFLLLFGLIDITYLAANSGKLMTGGWVPLVTAIMLFTVMKTWKWGSTEVYKFMIKGNIPLEMFIDDVTNPEHKILRIDGIAMFMVGNPNSKLNLLMHHIKHNKVLHKKVILMSIMGSSIPFVEPEERLEVKTYKEGFYEIKATYGYMESPDIVEILKLCATYGLKLNINEISFYLGRASVVFDEKKKKFLWNKRLFSFMHRNSGSATEYFKLPPGRVIEVGTKIMI